VEAELFKQTGYLDREINALRQWAAAAKDATPWLKLFYIDFDLGWRHEAGEAVKRAVALAPQDPHTLVARAIWSDRSHDSAHALPFVDLAMRLNPANDELANLRATILLKMERNAEAERVLRQALARDPAKTPNRLALAHALLVQGQTEEAVAQFHEVERREPGNVEAAYQLGVLAERQDKVAEAERELERAAAANAGFSNVLWHLGRLYLRRGRREEGRKLLQLYRNMDANTSAFETTLAQLEIRPDDAALHERLAWFHLQAGELPLAVVVLRRVLELRRGDAAARRALAAALTRQGRLTEARRLVAGLPLP
jgi:Flp pilus assembly protein TadD